MSEPRLTNLTGNTGPMPVLQETTMNYAKKKRIIDAVRAQCGDLAALTVNAALEHLWSEWTPELERKYGTFVAQYLLSNALTHSSSHVTCELCGKPSAPGSECLSAGLLHDVVE